MGAPGSLRANGGVASRKAIDAPDQRKRVDRTVSKSDFAESVQAILRETQLESVHADARNNRDRNDVGDMGEARAQILRCEPRESPWRWMISGRVIRRLVPRTLPSITSRSIGHSSSVLGEQHGGPAVVEAMIGLVHQCGFEVVAEGVESMKQLGDLKIAVPTSFRASCSADRIRPTAPNFSRHKRRACSAIRARFQRWAAATSVCSGGTTVRSISRARFCSSPAAGLLRAHAGPLLPPQNTPAGIQRHLRTWTRHVGAKLNRPARGPHQFHNRFRGAHANLHRHHHAEISRASVWVTVPVSLRPATEYVSLRVGMPVS